MRQILCAHLPFWPIDRLRRHRAELRHNPLIIVESIGNRQVVTATSPDAPQTVRPGITSAQARAHCAGLTVVEAEPDKDQKSLEALGYWLTRYSPNVAVCPPAAIFIDVAGLEGIFGSLQTLAGRVDSALKGLRINAVVAIAPTPGAAWALAAFGRKSPIVASNENLIAAVSQLPPAALRLEPSTVESLHALGIIRIGMLLKISRKDLAARFDPALLNRIDQILGNDFEPLNWLPHRAPIQAEIEFDGVVESLETLQLAIQDVLDEVIEALAERGLGAKKMRLILRRPYAPAVEKTMSLIRCSRESKALLVLLRHTLEAVVTDDGFIAVGLNVTCAERLSDIQTPLMGTEDEHNAAELDHLIERLRAKFGDIAEWAELAESHLPERAFSYRQSAATIDRKLAVPSRPICLLTIPRAIPVIVMPSESRNGQPVSFTDKNQVHRVAHVRGPERIAGRWWDVSRKTRDYFDVADSTGQRFWIFRVTETSQWYLHGIFE